MEKIELKLTALKFVKDNNYKEEGKTDLQLADEIYNWLNSAEKPKEEVDDKIYPSNSPIFDKDDPKFKKVIEVMNKDYRNHQSLKGILTHEDKAPEPENFIMEPELVKEMLHETKPFKAYGFNEIYLSKNGIKIDAFDSENDINDENEVAELIRELDESWDGNTPIPQGEWNDPWLTKCCLSKPIDE